MNAALYDKRDFVPVINLKILRWRDWPGLSSEPNMITIFLISEMQKETEKNMM